MDRRIYWIWLRMALEGNIKLMYALYSAVGTAEEIFTADKNDYLQWGVPEKYYNALCDKDLSAAYNIFGQCHKFDIEVVCIEDEAYPKQLLNIALPPCILFYRGHLNECLSHPSLTTIGTRYSTVSGEALAYEFVRGLSLSGFTIICGVAEGIEASVQRAVREADGRLILMLPCGLLSVGRRVKDLIRDTVPCGAVVSELLPHEKTRFDGYHMRNRIMSALSDGTVVLQAPLKSGAVMTANYALQQGREVFVLPGGLRDPSYAGNNALLRDGAVPALDFTDIVDYYKPKWNNQLEDIVFEDTEFEEFVRSVSEAPQFDNKQQQIIYSVLNQEGKTVDEIVEGTSLPAHTVMAQLTLMEMKGWIAPVPVGKYKLLS